ncbi:elongation factor G [Cloacibacterium normanense]|uniref:Elongation factor G n=1 Tax=Cloacibacterium normanense TaxID=237258 RepID=A0A1E5UC98_9FLAO|nr:elongation factor G [Cloacibacterium normanense]AZI70471.1 elongation factor G [Cloacibacterium normanense]OEL10546.1 small GTP-binding domain protein [Cloacibacterium normanense]SDO27646.1 translation elongation factor 2 (EF-2/EF-G) [Cloacibacterium normanense]
MSTNTKDLRNVVLLGHSGSGKTTFIETMLYEGGAIKRRGTVEQHNTVSDNTDLEHERENTIFSHQMFVNWKKNKINILDTPGFDDFVGEVIANLKVADTALIMVNAAAGVEVGTELVWEYVEDYKTPSIFVINQMDHQKADYDAALEQLKNRFGSKVIPIQYPLNSGESFNQIVDALRMVMYEFPATGGKPEKKPIPESEMARANEMHNALVEMAAENEEGLMEKYFEEGNLSEEELAQGLMIGLAKHDFFPVFVASGAKDMGSGRIMGFIDDIAPSPADRFGSKLENGEVLTCNAADKTTIFIYKTQSEPQVGVVSYFKVFSGEIKPGDELINANNGELERISQIFVAEGKERTAVDKLVAGDLGVTVKLKSGHSNNTLNTKGVDRKIEPMKFPESRLRKAVFVENTAETEKLFAALNKLKEEDPTLKVEIDHDTHEAILGGQGQLHLDLVKYRLEKDFGVKMEMKNPKISYRETITGKAEADYRHKKQSGGAGQFGEIHMRVENYYEGMPEPEGVNIRNKEFEDLPWGGKFAFYWCIVGGAIDSRYIGAIKKGIMQQLKEGPLTGSHCQNIRVSVYDGKMHSVDSNDISFQLAASGAFKEAFHNAHPQLLEPMYHVEILAPDECTGDVMGDLQTRRAMISGMDSEGHYQKIMAEVPLAEMNDYGSTLRSLTGGRAKFSMKFSDYQLVPANVQQDLVKKHAAEKVEA